LKNKFVSVKVKKTLYNGKKATAVYMCDNTRKIKQKIDLKERLEIHQSA